MFTFIKKLLNRKLAYKLDIGDYVLFETMISDCFGEYMDAFNLCFYTYGKVISEPKFEDGNWMQLISLNEEIIPDEKTFNETNWKETNYPYPPAHWFYIKKRKRMIKIKQEGLQFADFLSQRSSSGGSIISNSDKVFFADKDDSSQDKYLLEEISLTRKKKMIECWKEWMKKENEKVE